ncbi:hypothetical protein Tco_0806771 [Tanacetum coccineum]
MDTKNPLLKDSYGDNVDVHLYRSMIGSLMYLTSSRPDIMFAVCTCARFQVTPKVSHSHAVKRIFRYLKGQPKLGLWYPRDSPFDLVAYSDSDYAGASLDRKSTTRGCLFLGCRLISWQCKKQTMVATSSIEVEYVAGVSCCGQDKQFEYLMLNASPLKHVKRGWDTKIPQSSGPLVKVGDEAVHKELGDRMERAATTASSLEAEQDSDAQTRFEAASKQSNDPPLSRVNTLGSGEDSMKLIELMAHCTTLSELSRLSLKHPLEDISSLEDSDGISTLPTAEIFRQLALIGGKELGYNMKRASKGYSGVNTPLFQTMLVHDQGEGPTILFVSHHTPTSSPSTLQPPSTLPSIQTTPIAEEVVLMPYDSPLPRVHSLGSDEGSLSLNELTVLCTSLSKKVESLESELKQTKQTYSTALTKLIKREDEEDSSKQGRSLIEELDMDAGISLVPSHVAGQGRFDDTQVSDQPKEQLGVFSAAKVLADATKQRRDVENVQTYTRRRRAVSTGSGGVSTASELVSIAGVKAKDKGKAKVHEEEQARFNAEQEAKFKAEQEQERLDHETAMKIQEELDAAERQRMAQVHQAAQGFTDDEWDDILARVAADKDFVQQLQAGEKVSDEDLPRKLVELVNQRKKFFAQQRAEAKRNKPMTPAQQKEYMSTYIKNQEGGYTLKQLKALSFEEVKEIFEATMRKVQSFVPMDSELEVQRLKRAGQDVVEEPAKRQRTGEASGSVQEQTGEEPKAEELSQEQLHQMMMVIPVEEKIIRVGGHTEAYQTFDDMLKKFDRDDLDKLWNLVKERFRTTEPTEDKARELWVELKRLFEPDDNDTLWKLQRYMHDPLKWWLYDTCGVHHVSTERGHDIYMLVEKDYPLTKALMTLMLWCNNLR